MTKTGKLELTWSGKYDEKRLEPRILVEDKEKSNSKLDVTTKNMLIHGDNLLALKALEQDFQGKVKCIYIDPPYNTGSAFEHYDDGLEHSIWLSMMRSRIELLRSLLSDDGGIFIQIDDNEQAYLKVLCDEIFGRNNFVSSIAVKMSTLSGVKTTHRDKTIVKEKETILIYSKNNDNFRVNPQYVLTNNFDSEFQYYLDKKMSDNPDDWVVLRLNDVLKEKKISLSLDNKEFIDFLNENKDKIWRRAFIRNEYKQLSQSNPDKIYYVIKDDKEHYYYRGREMFFLSDKYQDCFTEDGTINGISMLLGDIWTDVNTGKLFNEGGIEFRNSKKPEFLIARILKLMTVPGDYVLDSFLGSGTTVAVAHKMNRKWIGIELGEHAYTHCKIRLDSVIDGEQGGISKAVDWNGGGGYRFYELAPSLLERHEVLPVYQISKEYSFEMLCEAICKLEGFKFHPQGEMHGRSSETRFIHIASDMVTGEYVKQITKELGENDSVLIYGTKIQSNLRLPDNIEIKRIPKDLIKKFDFESEIK